MVTCPICNFIGEFMPYGTNLRPNALCPKCLSLERKRLLYFILVNDLKILENTNRTLLHFAPSKGLYRFFKKSGFTYLPKDIDVQQYVKHDMDVGQFDMCNDFDTIKSGSIDIIVSTHVLEHPKCSYKFLLNHFNRILSPNGIHIISVPMSGDKTRENYDLSEDERLEQFGGRDHWRIFGHKDFPLILKDIFGNVFKSTMYSTMTSNDIKKYGLTNTPFYISYKE